jgi:hypothetical protein
VGGSGILATFPPTLSSIEEAALRKSAEIIAAAIKSVRKN